ncbi:hypothetical protein SEMRO_1642_G288090.1 [Seminavis robusta]|uniref:Uncharacterized protein n=1 Tax=Seminavis robusta TaxID=568900 RepID=A0A9N8ETE3_9STRA|nr:hypothetical protein SEMRO_1642_G288090.1 [Seminavis robusta]|eukprot:Sro1642_g288090.1 n/a (172) ;mRNA; r:21074-21589
MMQRMSAMGRMGLHVLQRRAFNHEKHFVHSKYWKYINFVGNVDTGYQDAKAMLEHLGEGLWQQFGVSGWADTPEEAKTFLDSVLKTSGFIKDELNTKMKVSKVITNPDMEVLYNRLQQSMVQPDKEGAFLLQWQYFFPGGTNAERENGRDTAGNEQEGQCSGVVAFPILRE